MEGSGLVFLVDDNADYRYLVQQAFKFFLQKHRIQVFANGSELIKTIGPLVPTDDSRPIAILLDIDMPQMDGFETLVSLKENPVWKKFKVIMMTNRDQPGYREEAFRLGAYAFLLKPNDMVKIRSQMTEICEMTGSFAGLGEMR